jgi:hypothetical protein
MLDRLIFLLERFVMAFERMAIAIDRVSQENAPLPSVKPGLADPPPTAAPVQDPPITPAQTKESLDREKILLELRELKVKYKPTARTETLAKLLKETQAQIVAASFDGSEDKPASPAKADDFGEPLIKEEIIPVGPEKVKAPPPELSREEMAAAVRREFHSPMVITLEQLRESLVSVAGKKGRDVGLAILKTHGKKEKLSDVERSCYPAIMAACMEALR